MKRKNGTGSVYKLSGKRRNPYAARITTGYKTDEETQKSQPIYQFIGFYPTQDEALHALMEYNRQPYNISGITFGDVYDKWFAIKETEIAPKTVIKFKDVKKRIKPIWDKPIKEFDLPTLQNFVDSLEVTKSNLVNIKLGINQTLNFAAKRGYVSPEILDIIKLVDWRATKETTKIGRTVFTKEERALLWENKSDPTIRTILVFLYTGLRFDELYKLTEDCCHENYIEVRRAKTKAGVRNVPLCDCVLELLPIEPLKNYHTFRENFKIATGLLGMKHTIHDTRHTFITMMTEKDIDSRVIKQIVGHVTDDVTESVYTHVSMEKMLVEINKINCY